MYISNLHKIITVSTDGRIFEIEVVLWLWLGIGM